MNVINVEQRTPDWFKARLGRLTGSYADDMLATIKSGEAAARRDLRMRLVCERLTGQTYEDTFMSAAMIRGVDLEPVAFAAYEALTGQIVQRVGFCAHSEIMAGCSPDGYFDDFQGLLSLKVPKTTTHIGYLRANRFPPEYVPQMLCELWITGAQTYDFLSFDDRLPLDLQTFHIRVQRNDAAVAEFETRALAFLDEVDRELEALEQLRRSRAA